MRATSKRWTETTMAEAEHTEGDTPPLYSALLRPRFTGA
ncbi:hypothetical protein MINT15_36110 [Saccharomonospora viridis]|uniref:Uncharacterized protein n=1 Tax=Saccharomonospora viridis TaxID=1852 RepID=A0A837D6H3_9PSEU|nr:hypothetical protein MINT15_36110 [Saccharomonospora viridis]